MLPIAKPQPYVFIEIDASAVSGTAIWSLPPLEEYINKKGGYPARPLEDRGGRAGAAARHAAREGLLLSGRCPHSFPDTPAPFQVQGPLAQKPTGFFACLAGPAKAGPVCARLTEGARGQGSLGRCSQAARRPGQPRLITERRVETGTCSPPPLTRGPPTRNASGFTALRFIGAAPPLREATPVHRYLLALHA